MFYMIPGTEDKYRILSLTKFKQDFLRRPPELLIVNILHWGDHEAYRWMVTMYSPLAINTGKQSLHPFKLMALYGGSLEKRIQSASVKSSNTNNRQVP